MKKITILLLIAYLFTNCGGSQHQHDEEISLQTNDGKKWTVNPATHEGMTNIRTLLSSEVDIDSIGFKMADQTTYIINNCDMKGEAHDQLHLVLHPMLENIDTLKTSTDLEEIELALTNIRGLIEKYFKHFTIE